MTGKVVEEAQVRQVQNVINTLIEATDHFAALLKANEMKQGIDIFTSIIEGMESVFKVLPLLKMDFTKQMMNLEQALVSIGKNLEDGNLEKVFKLVENALRPELAAVEGILQ